MYSSIRQGDKSGPYIVEFVADQVSDLEQIPVDDIRAGSTCIIIADSSVYMLDHDKTWKLL